MPSWLSQLLPKLSEQLGLGKSGDKLDDGKGDGKGDDKSGDKVGDGKGTDKDAKGLDALGRTVSATLSPDGKTVEVTVKKPDGTEQRATLRVGEDGKLTCVEATPDRPGATGAGTDPDGVARPTETGAKPTATDSTGPASAPPNASATPAPTAPSPSASSSESAGSGAGATPSPIPVPAPAKPKPGGAQAPSKPDEPCPPAEQSSGADFAVTVP